MEETGVRLIAEFAAEYVSDMDRAGKATDHFADMAADAAQRASKIDSAFGGAGTAAGALGREVQGAGADFNKFADYTVGADGRLRDASGRFASAAEQAQYFGREVRGAGDAAEATGRRVQDSGRGFDIFKEIAIGALRAVGEAVVNLAAQGAQMLAGFVKDSIGIAGSFEDGMNNFAAAAGGALEESGTSLEQFRDLFLDIGKRLPVSTMAVQEAATTLVKAGIDPAVVAAGALESSIQFASAAQMDLAAAAELSVKQLATFGPLTGTAAEQTEFMAMANDLLVQAAGASTLNVDKLGDAMLAAGGQARTAGLDYNEFVTAMGMISGGFGTAAEAGTSFKNFLVRLQPATAPAREAMSELGLMVFNTDRALQTLAANGITPVSSNTGDLTNQLLGLAGQLGMTEAETGKFMDQFARSAFYDAEGNFGGMANAAQLLQDATVDLTEADRVRLLQQVFGNDAMGAAASLARQGAEGYNEFAASMAQANGVGAQAAAVQQGFNTALDNAKGSIEALQITVGTGLLPVLEEFLNETVAPGVNNLTTFATEAIASGDAMGYIGTKAAEAAPGLFEVINFISANAMPILAGLAAVILAAVVPGFVTWAAAAWTTSAATLAAMAPISVPILAIGAAVAGLALLWQSDFGGIATFLTGWWNGTMAPVLATAEQWLGEQIPVAVQTLSDVWTNGLQPALAAVWGFLDANVLPILASLADVGLAVAELAVKSLMAAWEDLQPTLDIVWIAFQEGVRVANTLLGPAMSGLGVFVESITGGFDGLSAAVDSAVGWLSNLADTIRAIPPLPDVFTPGSPTPAEIGFYGIAEAMAEVSAEAKRMGGVLEDLPTDKVADILGMQATTARTEASFGRFMQDFMNTDGMSMGMAAAMQELGAATSSAFAQAMQEAQQLAEIDPQLAQQWLRERLSGIQEIAELQKELLQAREKGDLDRVAFLEEQLRLAKQAGQAELAGLITGAQDIEFEDDTTSSLFAEWLRRFGGSYSSSAPTYAAPVAGAISTNNYNYAPSYGSAPAQPSQDFFLMQSWALGG